MTAFSLQSRSTILNQLETASYDLIIIGGGITGAGILRDAALRGLSALLVEKGDFASGTSSKSSKLVHGGLRYLQQREFALTMESCLERNLLVKQNPHLVRPIPFVFPVYREDKYGPASVRIGMWIYEILSGFKNFQSFQMLSPTQTLEQIPDLRSDGLRASAYYYDAAVDDARLTLESIKAAVHAGAHAVSYAPVEGLLHEHEKVVGVVFRDLLANQSRAARAPVVVNATGAWVDTVRKLDNHSPNDLSPSKGIHLVIPGNRIRQNATVAFNTVQDRRMIFAIPWGKATVIGTTDTFYEGDLDQLQSEQDEVDYLLRATNHAFPNAHLGREDLVGTFAGVRPLIAPRGQAASASSVSRESQIFQDPSGMVSIAGGKLTTYRRMARSIIDLVIKRLPESRTVLLKPCLTDAPIGGELVDVPAAIAAIVAKAHPDAVARHLVANYGYLAPHVLDACASIEGGLRPFHQGFGYLRGEIVYAAREESVVHLSDLLMRRLRFALWVPGQGLDIAEDASRLLGHELNWSEEQRLEELAQYRLELKRFYQPVVRP